MPSDEQRAAHVRKTRMANYHASMRLEGFYVEEGAKMSNKKTLIRKYKKLAMKCA
nr:YhfG family protein [Marinobacter sp. tcs-11]